MTFRRRCTFIVVLVFTFAAAGACLSSQALAGQGGSERRLHGRAQGQVAELTLDESSGQIGAVIEYQGIASHLGQFARTEWLYINPNGQIFGKVAFRAANGDQVFANFTGQFVAAGRAEGSYTITGGTGRFDGATGKADFVATTPDLIHVKIAFAGTISY